MNEYDELLTFMRAVPIGLVRFKEDGSILMANPAAMAILLTLTDEQTVCNIYEVNPKFSLLY